LNASQNQIEEVDIFEESNKLTYLQLIDFKGNQIKELTQINLPNLLSLIVPMNQITSAVKFKGHPKLKFLNIKRNKLNSLAGISNMPLLEEIKAGGNDIANLEGLENLPSLKLLHMQKNPVLKN